MNRSIQCRVLAGSVAALVLLGFTVPGIAYGQTWNGAGGDSNWSTPGNWVGAVAPVSGNATVVSFVTAASGFVSTVDAPFTLNRLDLLGTAAYTLGGAAISFDGTAPQLTLAGPYGLANDLSFLVTTIIDAQTNQVLTGQVAGVAGLTKTGAGRLTLAGSVFTWGGPTTVSAGTLQIGNGVSGPNFFLSPIVVDGEIDFAGTVPGIDVANSLSGTGTVTVSGGTMTGSGPVWTHSGPTNITGGTLAARIDSPGRLTVTGTGVLQTGDSFFGSLSDGAIPGTGSVFSNATAITIGSDNTSTTFSGTIGSTGGLTKVGTGTFTIGGATLPMTGVLTVNGGRVNLLASGAGGAIVNGGGTLGGTGTVSGPVTVNAGGTLAPGLSAGTINTGNLNVAGALVVEIGGTGAGTQYDVASVAGTVNVTGGTLTLAGAYAPFAGDTFTIVANDGADAVTGTFAGLPEGATVVFNGATLRISYVGGTGNDITLTALAPTSTVWNGAGANDNWGTGANWIGSASPASGNATAVTFPTASARFGPVVNAPWTVNRMDVTGTTAYAMTGQAITFAGAAPQLNASGGAHSVANPLTLSAALAVNNASALTLSGAIGGAAGITKSGAGRLTLPGTSAFTGGTTVNAGTLLVNGTIPGPVVVNGGATLGGTGTINGPVTINAGGTLAAGLSPGITNTGNLVLAGIFLVEIEGATLGTQYDNTNVTGTVNVTGAALTLVGAHLPAAGSTYTLITNDGADAVVGTFAGLAEGATVTFNGAPMRISYVGGTGNDVVLTATAAGTGVVEVPTLSEWGLAILALLMGGAGMISARRRTGPAA